MKEQISSETFKQWLISIGKSNRTAQSYASAIHNTISNIASERGLTDQNLYNTQDPKSFHDLNRSIQKLPEFQNKDNRGNGMYSSALKQYAEFLDQVFEQQLREDIEEVLLDNTISSTEKSILINSRIGQGEFRHQLIEYWQGCSVSGYQDVRFLIASHIKPWKLSSPEERLTPYNGLLLLPNIDKVFDLGYITFTDIGRIQLSPQLESYADLGIDPDMSIQLNEQHRYFMAYHREQQFKG